MFLEHWFDGVFDRAPWRYSHDLSHLVRKIDFKDVSLVRLKDVEVLCVLFN